MKRPLVSLLAMGLVAGPAALIAAYGVTYLLHGSAGPAHSALLHREARARNRATVLSINSMVASVAFGVAAPLFGLLADRVSTQVAMGAVMIGPKLQAFVKEQSARMSAGAPENQCGRPYAAAIRSSFRTCARSGHVV